MGGSFVVWSYAAESGADSEYGADFVFRSECNVGCRCCSGAVVGDSYDPGEAVVYADEVCCAGDAGAVETEAGPAVAGGKCVGLVCKKSSGNVSFVGSAAPEHTYGYAVVC